MKRFGLLFLIMIGVMLLGPKCVLAAVPLPIETQPPTIKATPTPIVEKDPVTTSAPKEGCLSDTDCNWCGNTCQFGTGMRCPNIMPPEGMSCRCMTGSCSSVADPIPTVVVKPTSGLTCVWCGDRCQSDQLKTMCTNVTPEAGKQCVTENGACVIKSGSKCGGCPGGNCDIFAFIAWKNDFLAYKLNAQSMSPVAKTWIGDFDCNRNVDVFDFIFWKNNFKGGVAPTRPVDPVTTGGIPPVDTQ